MVFSNGDVVSCENDYNATIPLGNVLEQSLNEIFSSKRAMNFLRIFRKNMDQFSFCRTCELRDIKHHTANVKTFILNREFYDYAKDA